MAAREFASQYDAWDNPETRGWLPDRDLEWRNADRTKAWSFIQGEISQLQMLMQDDRDRYLAECDVQADGLADYVMAFVGIAQARRPWTVELISCGLAIGNIAYMSYKAQFKRVRPSVLCPGLVPPFGPPMHPAFPSGHSFLGHLIALLLLEIPDLVPRFGVFKPGGVSKGRKPEFGDLDGEGEIPSPLFWLSQRLAKNRERLGVHYSSDSMGSRHLAQGIWRAMLPKPDEATKTIHCPTLEMVIRKAAAEWT